MDGGVVKSVAKEAGRSQPVGIRRPLLVFGSDELAAGDFLPGLTGLLQEHLILRLPWEHLILKARDPLE